jgi:hypothetical protein
VTPSFKAKGFARFANREGLPDRVLCRAVGAMGRGRIDADLGGGVIKQRLPRPGQGKSGGYRAIVVFRRRGCVVFVFGYAKSARRGIDARELAASGEAGAGDERERDRSSRGSWCARGGAMR